MTDPDGNATFYQYDELGRRTHEAKVSGQGLAAAFRDDEGNLLHAQIDETIDISASTEFAGFDDLGDGFTATWTGAIYLDFSGDPSDEVRFYLNSTDESVLYIDDQEVVSNSSGMTEGMQESYDDVTLVAGWHRLKVVYTDTNYDSDDGLIVSYDPGTGKVVIPDDVLFTTQVTTTGYDDAGRVETITDPNENTTTYGYDDAGRVETITDPNENTTTYGYDDANRLTSESIFVDEDMLTRVYKYDRNSNLVQKTDRNGRVITYEYDPLNRVKYERWYADQDALDNEPESPLETISYEYDEVGNLRLLSDSNATYEYDYDDLDRQTGVEQSIAELGLPIAFVRAYDTASRMTSTSAEIDNDLDYENSYSYDTLGRLTKVIQAAQPGGNDVNYKRVDIVRNSLGQIKGLVRKTTGDDDVFDSSYLYDRANRLKEIDHDGLAPGYNFFAEYLYAFDRDNRILSYTYSPSSESTDYTYDALGQLTDVDRTGSFNDRTYEYDSNGNRTADGALAFQIGDNNRIQSDDTFIYQYDGEGNLIRKTRSEDDSYIAYSWDHRNRLTEVSSYSDEDILVGSATYVYDALNQLIVRGTETLVYDDGQVVLRFLSDNLHDRYLWGPEVDQLLADEQIANLYETLENETLWMLADAQGSIRDIVDDNGIERKHVDFDAFGAIQGESWYDDEGDLIEGTEPWVNEGAVDQLFYGSSD